jgi:hypothetical protein
MLSSSCFRSVMSTPVGARKQHAARLVPDWQDRHIGDTLAAVRDEVRHLRAERLPGRGLARCRSYLFDERL